MLVAGRQFTTNVAAMGAVAAASPTVANLFAATLWTGNGAARSITTGIDMTVKGSIFIKQRNADKDWGVFDTQRGTGKYISTNLLNAETTNATTLTAFNSTGIALGTDSATIVNQNAQTYVGHSFKAASRFFDVIAYSGDNINGRSISHNLGHAPGMVIVKNISSSNNWVVWHRSLTSGRYILLTSTPETTTSAASFFGNGSSTVDPDASSVTVASSINATASNYVMYAFGHDVATDGIIQCGSYTGNGSTTGPIVTLGWEPQFLMIKARGSGQPWFIIDSARGFTVGNEPYLVWDFSQMDVNFLGAKPLSTGFQLETSASDANGSGAVYLYMAIRKAGT